MQHVKEPGGSNSSVSKIYKYARWQLGNMLQQSTHLEKQHTNVMNSKTMALYRVTYLD